MIWRSGEVGDAEAGRLATVVGEPLRTARIAVGLSRQDLATRTGVSAATIAGYERGRQRPTVATLTKLAGVLCPDAAAGFVEALARAAGSSLAGVPMVPVTLARDQVVQVLAEALARFGIDVADDQARAVVVDAIRYVTGQPAAGLPADPRTAPPAATPGPSDARSDDGGVRNP